MIIKSAKAYMDLTPEEKAKRLNSSPHWYYLEMQIDGVVYAIVFEWSAFYGYRIRQWMIDGRTETDVKWRFEGMNGFLEFDCSNNQCGVRQFENECIIWEFLLKPMGIPWEKVRPNYSVISKITLGYYGLKQLLIECGIGFVVIKEGNY